MILYNENDPYAAEWLRRLSEADLVQRGRVDDRDVRLLSADDVRGATRFHAFAGIGGWDLALRLARWPAGMPVWTGSCPCQPFSVAGKRRGFADDRHLWPEWFRLVRECRPPIVLGEQVAGLAGLVWLDAVSADLEGEGYAVGAADLCAAGVGAPHVRQRLYFIAVGDPHRARLAQRQGQEAEDGTPADVAVIPVRLANADEFTGGQGSAERGGSSARGDADEGTGSSGGGVVGGLAVAAGTELRPEPPAGPGQWSLPPSTWNCDWLPCLDGKSRPVGPGTFPLAHGVPGRVGRLRAYGNAVVPQVAAVFVRAVMDVLGVA